MKVDLIEEGKEVAYVNGIILDGTENMQPQEGKVIIVLDGKIEKIVPKEECNLEKYNVVDLEGKYIMPGLINLHVHMPATGKPSKKQKDLKKLVKLITSNPISYSFVGRIVKKNALMELNSGVTTLRAVGGILNSESKVRDAIKNKKFVGPRMFVANEAISVPGGHMAGSLAYEAKDTEDVVKYMDIILKNKPDLIKLMVTGGVLDAVKRGEPGVLKMAPEMIYVACRIAHNNYLKVAAHVESTEGVKVALENGVDTIEHGAKTNEEIIRLFKEKNACHVATFSAVIPYAKIDREITGFSEDDQFNANVVFQGIVDCANECLKEGIPVGLGTDTGCPYITHYDMWREIYYFTKYCNVSNNYALHTATEINARILGMDDKIGTIKEGKYADMIVSNGNPLEDIKVLRNLDMVIIDGNRINKPQIKKMENVEKELDKFLD